MIPAYTFISGMVAAGFLVAGLFFIRFWRKTHDQLFISFALAFWLLGLGQAQGERVEARGS